jgi:hypothetical protein
LNIFSKSCSENADQSKRKKAFLLGERTQTRRKVVEFHKKRKPLPKTVDWWGIMQKFELNIFSKSYGENADQSAREKSPSFSTLNGKS